MAKTRKVSKTKSGAAVKLLSESKESSHKAVEETMEEGEELFHTEYAISASEDEAQSDDERKHCKLLEAISGLDGKKRRKLAERSEASTQVSEFSVSAEGAGEKIDLKDLLGTIAPAAPSMSSIKKQLNKLQYKNKTLELPLSRQETEKIQRVVAYEKTSKKVTRWDHVVRQHRKAEQLVFPLNQEPGGIKPVEQVVASWKVRTPLELEIFNLLHKNKQPVTDPILTPVEEASLRAMSLEEAKMRRAELQKARALQSYYEARAKRERRIKSKKYHRVLKKAKQKEVLKQFEELRKTNPDAALEELKKMDRSRIEERMSLKHQNSGKWAKSKAIMAKYDDEARRAMQQQLEVNKELTRKLVVPSESEDEEPDEEEEVLPGFVNEAQPGTDYANPWMQGKLSSDPSELAGEAGGEAEAPAPVGAVEESEEEEEEEEDEALLREFEERRRLRKEQEEDTVPAEEDKEDAGEERCDEVEEEDVSEFNSLFQRLVGNKPKTQAAKRAARPPAPQGEGESQEQRKEDREEREEPALLDERLTRVQTMEELENLEREETLEAEVPEPDSTMTGPGIETEEEKPTSKAGKRKRKKVIDPEEVLTRQAKVIKVPSAPTAIEDEEGDEEQKMIIKEAFASDDVIADFLKDKQKQTEMSKPKDVDLTLPGWGEWGGVGLKPSTKKRRRFLIKAAPGPPRRDRNLPNVIISEKRDASVAAHQVNDLPFPFSNPTQFERNIRAPIGHNWNTQRTVQKLTAPKIITKMGTIIDPIDEEDLAIDKKPPVQLRIADILLTKEEKGKKNTERKGRSPQSKRRPQNKRRPQKRIDKKNQQKSKKAA
ncbi:U3 small nucleolar RNA-associated protein 14 homolog A-like [Polyodon spathula]|uniref:U3 small nucleolar RNA-associated protein 14 homolog A-like n=1 Tax=Polyodon spathula TaxID=7913 RepID=UPI001B7E7886|nr:U3 small nucleolar RNA-associated protein 14 homolog A-like [Polyodon spathula]